MNTQKLLTLLAAALLAAGVSGQVTPPATTTTYTGGGFSNTTSWTDAILPVSPEVGAVALDGNLNSTLTNYRVVQTAGTISSGFNRNFVGTDWYIVDGALLFYSTTNTAYTNLNNSALGVFNIYLLGGTFDAAAVKNQGGSVVYVENGVLTAHNSLQLQTGGILRFGPGTGSANLAALQYDTSSPSTSVIDFLSGSEGSLTVTGFVEADFSLLFDRSVLKIDGVVPAGTFADNFTVTGSTLTLAGTTPPAVPSPTAIAGVSAGKLTITFDRVADETLLYEVLAGNDLSTWGSIWTSTGVENVAGPVTVDDTETLTAGSKRFLKLEVTRP